MTTRSRTPVQLEPYLGLPSESSLTLLTSTLECSADWLTARFATNVLTDSSTDLSIILVSWNQDERAWYSQLKVSAGTEVTRLPRASALIVIDRLKDALLHSPRSAEAELQDVELQIIKAIEQTSVQASTRAVLVFDQPDILLGTHPALKPHGLNSFVLKIRSLERVHAVLISCTADIPMLSQHEEASTPLESNAGAFLVQQAHMSDRIFSCRALKTGSARDVSGVIRITSGGSGRYAAVHDGEGDLEKRYLVQRDGIVRVVE